ncbi:MAG TPA: LLM class flavin-dependent oxidoreductase [Blastocatellia bacterium]|jgi:alkanesulfonate monooxygenase SsuD/methylene tetrahydromethanopterin reductase-like flavin-dependent oxidoreductase (luciferase family)
MRFFFFHLMSWPFLPEDFEQKYDSAWIWCPNTLFDPARGGELYNEYIDTLVLAEELGFDGVCVNEHHQNAYGLMPSPNLIASILARQTSRIKIAVIGNALPLYNPPTRVAEEFAMIDCISGGRLIAGFVVGGGPEYFSLGINPTYAREMFREAHDLIIRAWTEPGPFRFFSKHYHLSYVNPWPRPLQQPHPPVWIPGVGSLETMEFVAKRRYAYMGIPYFHIDVFKRTFDLFREACEREGYSPDPDQMGWAIPVYVAETDEQARREFEPSLWYFARKLLKGIDITPPGYTSIKSALAITKNQGKFLLSVENWDQVEKGVYAIVGSPATVRDKLIHYQQLLGAGNILTGCQVGSLTHEQTRRSLRLLAEEVIPYVRQAQEATVRS